MTGRDIVPQLEKEMMDWFGVRHIFFVSSGTAALALILSALKTFVEGREVVVPAYSCYAVPAAVVRAGLVVVPCDVDPETLDFDPASLEGAINDRTLAVVAVHPFGIPADLPRVRRLCMRTGAFVVEDAAQAMGVVHDRRMLGTSGDVGFVSLGRGKAVTCGSGGVIVTNSNTVAERIRALYATMRGAPPSRRIRNILALSIAGLFLSPSLYWIPDAIPALGLGETIFDPDFPMWRFGRFEAGVLSGWRERLERQNRVRMGNGLFYARALEADCRAGRCRVPRRADEGPIIRFPLLLPSGSAKTALFRETKARRLGISSMYPDAITGIESPTIEIERNSYPRARAVAETLVTLPTHPLMRERDREDVVACVKAVLASGVGSERRYHGESVG